jgi:UDP-3-O-[3-hydroxymyristoyl] N-acetylglucosamine deacetylase
VGVHSGQRATVQLRPAGFGEGLVLHVDDRSCPVRPTVARAVPGATVLGPPGAEVSTPEHLLAALLGMGVTDTHIHVSGPEVPVLDGSASPWCEAIEEAGVVEGPLHTWSSWGAGEVCGHGGRMVWSPGEPSAVVHVDFGEGGPTGSARWVPGDDFVGQVAWARTFVLAGQVEALRAMGRGRGATAGNTLVWGQGVPRRPDEPVVHKLLDLLGDLAVQGPLRGRVEVWRGSHALHHLALAEMR